jgi:hypothetical protein
MLEPGETFIMMNFITSTLYQILLDEQVKEEEMGRACSMHGRDQKRIQNFSQKPGGRYLLEYQRIHRRII